MLQPDPLLYAAIEQRRLIRLVYHGKDRLVEPHDHGILNGVLQLLAYQIDGSSGRPLPNWLLMKIDEMRDLAMLDETFPGGSPTATGRHIQWDVLFIRVQPAPGYQKAGSP